MTLSELFDKADEIVEKRFECSNASIREMNEYRDGYIHGMTEKLEESVPVDKIRDWLYKNFFEYEDNSYLGGGYVKLEPVFDTFEEMIESFNRTVEG